MPHRALTHPARPQEAPAPPPVSTAPYTLVRATVLARPAQSAPAAAVRALLARLTAVEAADAALRPTLCDDLHAGRAGHGEAFHRQVVLPLRRDLHNGRPPRAVLLARLADLPARTPRLAEWLELRARRTSLLDDLAAAVAPALAAERAALAELCRSPAFTRAVALTSADLLRAVGNTARDGGAAGERRGRARKEEAAVLRHALRATSKTSPLSWFTAVGWAAGGDTAPRAVVKENRTLVGALVQALLDEPRRSRTLPHRMASAARIDGDRARYARTRVVFAGGRYLVTREEEVELAARPELALLGALSDTPDTPARLTERLTAALGRADGDPAVHRFVGQLLDARLLVPADPVDPQDQDPLRRLGDWLRQWPEDADLSRRLHQLSDHTAQFHTTQAERRPALLAALAADWRRLLADAGRPVPPDAAPLTVLTEDVHAAPLAVLTEDVHAAAPPRPRLEPARPIQPGPRSTGHDLDGADRAALGELTALAELFDLGHLMRRAARDRFVARYGVGGVCVTPWEFGADAGEAWADAGRTAGPPELRLLREEFTATPVVDGELLLPTDRIRALAARLPDWTAARPLSYSWFVQHDLADGLLCVNHVYGGWGRFTSRFLDAGTPQAADVARQIRRGLGDGARAAQIRPVGGFNANLHPRLLADEIGPDRRWTNLAEPDLDLVHDPATDQLRFRLRTTGEALDVLYLGFLAPIMLPQRLAPLLADHPNGIVDFRPLLPRTTLPAPGGTVTRTPRLRYGHVVLARRRWHLPAAVLDALRADLAAETGPGDVPAATAARWRALLDLPEQLFLHPVPDGPAAGPETGPAEGHAVDAFIARLRAPKPQPVDLGNPLHLHHLAKWLTRHPRGVVLEEALPALGGRPRPTGAVELVAETYRPARPTAVPAGRGVTARTGPGGSQW
ncbi:lantibiotic dehydratase [Kitasatospora sp. NPDC058478]|uniref:lantibiotic dehydratase n=1 Tax=unclassified Kitasatospora TaxID=2633591 RepID=UPI00365AA320